MSRRFTKLCYLVGFLLALANCDVSNSKLSGTFGEDLPSDGVDTPSEAPVLPKVQFSILTSTVNETNANFSHTIDVELSDISASTITVDYAIDVSSTATDTSDYTLTAGTLSFLPGETLKNIDVTINGDSNSEIDEKLVVKIQSPSGADLGTKVAHELTFVDDEIVDFTWTGQGADDNWTTTENWWGGVAPGPGETALFNEACLATNCDVTVDGLVNVTSLFTTSDFTGNIQFTNGNSITLGSLTLNNGTLTQADQTMNINGAFVFAGGHIEGQSGEEIQVAGNFTHTGGTASWNGGLLIMDGGSGATISTSGLVIDDFHFRKTANLTVSGTIVVENEYHEHCTTSATGARVNSGTIQVRGNVTGSTSSWCGAGSTTIELVDSGPHVITTDNHVDAGLPHLVINTSGDVTFSGNVHLSKGLTYVAANSVTTTGSHVYFGTNEGGSLNSGPIAFNNVTIQKSYGANLALTGNVDIDGNLIVFAWGGGSDTINGGTILLSGNYTATMSATKGGTTALTLDGAGNQNISVTGGAKLVGGTITVNKASGNVTQNSNLVLGGTQDIVFAQSATWDMNGYDMTVDQLDGSTAAGTVDQNGGTLTNPGGIIPTVTVL